MNTHRIELTLSVREVVILLLIAAGAWLWTVPGPPVHEDIVRMWNRSLDSRIVEQHNATTSQRVHAVSELSVQDRQRAKSALVGKEAAQVRALLRKIDLAAMAQVGAACCWFAAVLTLLVHVRSEWLDTTRRPIKEVEGRIQHAAHPDRTAVAPRPA